MTQPSLFDFDAWVEHEHAPYVPHSVTSKAAAVSIAPTAGTLRAEVLAYLRKRADGATDEEMQAALHMNPSTQRPRRGELQTAGLVRDSGRTRKTKSGRSATVWQAI